MKGGIGCILFVYANFICIYSVSNKKMIEIKSQYQYTKFQYHSDDLNRILQYKNSEYQIIKS